MWSPTTAATAAHEQFGTELALLAGRGAHKTQKTRSRALSAGQSLHMSLYTHISLLSVPLGDLPQKQQQQASTCKLNWHFLRVVGRTRRKKHAAGHCLRDNLITWASLPISVLLNVPLGALRQQQQQHASTMGTLRRAAHAACVTGSRY